MRSWVLLPIIALVLTQWVSAQQLDMPMSPTLWANCSPSNPPKNVAVAGPTLKANKGSYRAWVQVSSVASPQGMCLNTTILWVSPGGLHPFLPQFTQFPTYPGGQGNGMELIDWSRTGDLLLAELRHWNTEPNDAPFDRRIMVFQPRANKKLEIYPNALLSDQKGRDCSIDFQLLGFTPDEWVALKAEITTFYEADESPATKLPNRRCQQKSEVLAIDPRTQRRRPLSSNFSAERYSAKESQATAVSASTNAGSKP